MALTLHVEIDAETGQFKGAIQGAGADLEKLRGSGERAARSLSQALEATSARLRSIGGGLRSFGQRFSLYVTTPIVGLIGLTAKLADTQLKAEQTLAAALKFSGGAVQQRLADMKAFASGLQAITTTGDEAILRMVQVAKSMGLTDEQAKRAAKSAIGIEAAFGIAAEGAIRYSAALEQGDTTMLNRYIPTLRLIEDDAARVAKAHQILAEAFDVATASAKAGLGPIVQMKNDLGDLGEEFGRAALPQITSFSGEIRKLIAAVRDLMPETKKWIVLTAAAVAVGGPIIVGLGLVAIGIGALLTPMGLATAAIVGTGGLVAGWAIFHEKILDSLEAVRGLTTIIRELRRDLVAEAMELIPNPFIEKTRHNLAGITRRPETAEAPPPPPSGGGPLARVAESSRSLGAQLSPPAQRLQLEGRAAELAAIHQRSLNAERERAAGIIEAIRTPQENFNAALKDYGALLDKGLLTTDQYTRAVAAAKADLDGTSDAQKRLNDAAERLGFTFASAFEDAAIAGRAWQDILQGLLEDIERMILRLTIVEPLARSITSALTGGGGAGAGGGSGGIIGFVASLFAAGGGVVGRSAIPLRMVPAAAFAGAPHLAGGGLIGGGVPAIVHRGEEILPPGHPRHIDNAGGGFGNVYIYAPEGSKPRVDRRRGLGGSVDLHVILDQGVADLVGQPGSRTGKAMERRFGLQRQLRARA